MVAGNTHERDRLYTWEEVSWMTGLSIRELVELVGTEAAIGAPDAEPPAGIGRALLEQLLEVESSLQAPPN